MGIELDSDLRFVFVVKVIIFVLFGVVGELDSRLILGLGLVVTVVVSRVEIQGGVDGILVIVADITKL